MKNIFVSIILIFGILFGLSHINSQENRLLKLSSPISSEQASEATFNSIEEFFLHNAYADGNDDGGVTYCTFTKDCQSIQMSNVRCNQGVCECYDVNSKVWATC